MNTVKKISTLFALALISQSSFGDVNVDGFQPNTESSAGTGISGTSTYPENIAYDITTGLDIGTGDAGNVRTNLQNTSQNAYALNQANITGSLNFSGLDSSKLSNDMAVNTNATNIASGSSYNDSTNDISSSTTDSSTNDYTSNTDTSRQFVTNPTNPPVI